MGLRDKPVGGTGVPGLYLCSGVTPTYAVGRVRGHLILQRSHLQGYTQGSAEPGGGSGGCQHWCRRNGLECTVFS